MIIALNATKGSGKDTVANYITSLKHQFIKLEYAKQIKNILKLIFNFKDEELYGTQEDKEIINKTYGISVRQSAIAFGDFMRDTLSEKFSEYKETTGNNYFVNYLLNQIEPNKNYVITDVRYNNEITEIRKKFPNEKVILIRLLRNTKTYNEETDNHKSENLNNIDNNQINYIVNNNGTIQELYQKINEILGKENVS